MCNTEDLPADLHEQPEMTHSAATGLPVVHLGRTITTDDVRALEH